MDGGTAEVGGRGMAASRMSRALDATLRASIGTTNFGLDGRLLQCSSALVSGVDTDLLNGHQRDSVRLRQPDSGAVLALNCFLNWQSCPELLPLAGVRGYRELRFDARCPTGIRGTPPLLEMVAVHDHGVVAVTARCTEYLARCRSKLAAGYARLGPIPGLDPWLELMEELQGGAARFRHVDAPALTKHALGLGQTFRNRPIVLLYLYLEPVEGAELEPFRTHRAELARLSRRVEGSAVQLVAQTFDDLWREWEALDEPAWLRGIVARLRSRYAVAMGEAGRL